MEKKATNFTTPILVFLLVVASFLVGKMWTQIQGLQGGQTTAQNPTAQITPTTIPSQPNPNRPAVLGQAQIDQIVKGGAATKGDPQAPVTIVEFSEYECPFCKRFVDETEGKIFQNYGDKIYYVFHDFPLPIHQNAQKASEAARCAGAQGKYWEMHDLLFQKRDDWAAKSDAQADFIALAGTLGLKTADFESCLKGGKFAQAVKDDLALGSSVGVSGTPSFFINGKILVGARPFESFKTAIEAALSQKQ